MNCHWLMDWIVSIFQQDFACHSSTRASTRLHSTSSARAFGNISTVFWVAVRPVTGTGILSNPLVSVYTVGVWLIRIRNPIKVTSRPVSRNRYLYVSSTAKARIVSFKLRLGSNNNTLSTITTPFQQQQLHFQQQPKWLLSLLFFLI